MSWVVEFGDEFVVFGLGLWRWRIWVIFGLGGWKLFLI